MNHFPFFLNLWRRPKPVTGERIIYLVYDFWNIVHGTITEEVPKPGNYSLANGFRRINQQLSEIGRVLRPICFIPLSAINKYSFMLDLDVDIRICPDAIRTKDGPSAKKKDNVDKLIIDHLAEMMPQMPHVTHLALASGDEDFLEILEQVRDRMGKKIIIIASEADENKSSLAKKMARVASESPLPLGGKMIYFFSPAPLLEDPC